MPSIYPCGPQRFSTGLIKTKETKDSGRKDRLMTSHSFEGNFITFTPKFPKEGCPDKITYVKKTYEPHDFQEIEINWRPGDIVQFKGKTYDGNTINCPITGSISISPVESPWMTDITEGNNPKTEIIDLEEYKENKEKENNQ